jgi:hypothetical protein
MKQYSEMMLSKEEVTHPQHGMAKKEVKNLNMLSS